MERRFERKTMKLSEIKLDNSNPNQMSDKQMKALNKSIDKYKSIDKFGYVNEIIIDKKTKLVADGEHRILALKEQGVTEAEVKVFDFKNETERRLFRQISNKLKGTHDLELDSEEIKKILETVNLEELTSLLGNTEQEIMNILNKTILEENDKSLTEEVDKLCELSVTCPKCGHEFKKKRE